MISRASAHAPRFRPADKAIPRFRNRSALDAFLYEHPAALPLALACFFAGVCAWIRWGGR